MKAAIVILNWNTRKFLKELLPKVIDSVRHLDGVEVIVADNASDDGSVDLMKSMFPQIRTLSFDRNYGFTGGYNKALKEIQADYYILMNSDVETGKGWLEPLLEWMESHPECGACAPKLMNWHNLQEFEYAGAAGGFIDSFGYPFCRGRVMGRIETDYGQYDELQKEVFWVSGACMVVRSELFHRLGGLDERFFAHMEEIDLCWRIQLDGNTICSITESKVAHIGGGTLSNTSPFKLFLNYRNNLLMLDNNLAKTFALRYQKLGMEKTDASRKGFYDARRIITARMALDCISALVYLVTFRFRQFTAVFKAHKEFRHLRRSPSTEEISEYLTARPCSEVRGIYGKWIVGKALFNGKHIFANILTTDFLKY